MGIYIDIKMPEDGLKNIMILTDGRVFQFSGYGNPKLLGTAVSVPPHGRLIDADTLTETINGIWDCNDLYFQPNDKICDPNDCKGCKWRETMDCFRRMVKHTPTIIPSSQQVKK